MFKRLPFGVKTAGVKFTRVMRTILGRILLGKAKYLADLLIYSKTMEGHPRIFKEVLLATPASLFDMPQISNLVIKLNRTHGTASLYFRPLRMLKGSLSIRTLPWLLLRETLIEFTNFSGIPNSTKLSYILAFMIES